MAGSLHGPAVQEARVRRGVGGSNTCIYEYLASIMQSAGCPKDLPLPRSSHLPASSAWPRAARLRLWPCSSTWSTS